jgi:hypothetical protein
MKHGNPIPYGINLDKKYGEGTAKMIYLEKDGESISMQELREMLEYWKLALKQLENEQLA